MCDAADRVTAQSTDLLMQIIIGSTVGVVELSVRSFGYARRARSIRPDTADFFNSKLIDQMHH